MAENIAYPNWAAANMPGIIYMYVCVTNETVLLLHGVSEHYPCKKTIGDVQPKLSRTNRIYSYVVPKNMIFFTF